MKLNDTTLFRQRCLINGEWVGDGAQFDQIYNPADNSVVGFVPRLGNEETQASINAAERAQKGWKAQTAKTRSQILRRWYELMLEHQDDLTAIFSFGFNELTNLIPMVDIAPKQNLAKWKSYLKWESEE
jgi:succinate-semialdehyde dehydrogenase/glutarate-semialdehyde dehydrogenase